MRDWTCRAACDGRPDAVDTEPYNGANGW